MKQKALHFITHPLISGSAILFFGSLLSNVLNFLFNLFMTRNLSLSDYGTVVSLTSLIMMPAIVASSIIPTVINFGATFFATNNLAMVRGLFYKITKPLFGIGLCLLLFFLIFANEIGAFFHITETPLIILSAFAIFITFVGAVNGALLQAKLAFSFITGLNFLSALIKIIIGVILIFLGYKAGGAMIAIFLAFTLPYFISFIPLRFLFDNGIKGTSLDTKALVRYGVPAALTTFSLTSLITTDIMLVKHFFPPEEAGLYAVLSLIGRVIFFFTAPIGTVMFPLIVQKHAKKENYTGIFFMAIALVLLPSFMISIFYFLFPVFTVQFFNKQKEALEVAPYLGVFGLYIAIYAVVSVLTNFYLSIKKTSVMYPLIVAAVMQIILISIYHQTFIQVIYVSMSIVSLLLAVLLLYYLSLSRGKKKEEKS